MPGDDTATRSLHPVRRRDLLTAGGAAAVGAGAGLVVPGLLRSPPSPDLAENRDRSAVALNAVGAYGISEMVWSVPTTEPLVALTFDDGPDPEFTPHVHEVLARYGIHSTFMCMGWNVVQHPDLFKETVAAGHEIGNHSWTHLDLAYQDEPTSREQMLRAAHVLDDALGHRVAYYRPPRGSLNGATVRLASELGYTTVLWTYFGAWRDETNSAQVRSFVSRSLAPGVIVDFHDGLGHATFHRNGKTARELRVQHHREIDALPAIIEDGLARGLRFVTVGGLLAARSPARPPDQPPAVSPAAAGRQAVAVQPLNPPGAP